MTAISNVFILISHAFCYFVLFLQLPSMLQVLL